MVKFDNHIRTIYKKTKCKGEEDQWPPFEAKNFVNLLLIRHLEKNPKKIVIQKVASIMQKGSPTNQIFTTTTDISDIFKCVDGTIAGARLILIDGAPGVGKTILSKEIACRWASNEFLSSEELVLLLFLRNPCVLEIKDIYDLVHYFYEFGKEGAEIATKCSKLISDSEGKNITIILDGYDEVSDKKESSSFIDKLIKRKIMPHCTIVVTSRQIASARLQESADIKVEILGFTEESKQNFLKGELKEYPDKLLKVTSCLKANSNLNHLCYIPFIITVLVCIAKEYDDLPTSQHELYDKFVVYTITRFLHKLNELKETKKIFSSINDLPIKYKDYLMELCEYAFIALKNNKIVFTKQDIKNEFTKFADAPGSWSGLGLLKAAKYFSIEENNDCTSYNFIHLSIQEYLAAYYITTLSSAQQVDMLKEYFFINKYLNMWIMYGGLCKEPLAFRHFLSGNYSLTLSKMFGSFSLSNKIVRSKLDRLYLFQVSAEFSTSNIHNLVSNVFKNKCLDLSEYNLSSRHIDTLTSILDKATVTQWKQLNLSHCNIGDTGCNQLCDSVIGLNNELQFDTIDLSHNGITLDGVKQVISLLLKCKAKVSYLSGNPFVECSEYLSSFAMKYACAETLNHHPLTVYVQKEENAIFNQVDKINIIKHLDEQVFITGLYFINCELNDSVMETLSSIIQRCKVLNQLYIWDANINDGVVNHLLSIFPQKNQKQTLFIYGNGIISHDLFPLPKHTFMFLGKFSLILNCANDVAVSSMFSFNPMKPKTEKLRCIYLLHCTLSYETVSQLTVLYSTSNNITKFVVIDNNFEFRTMQLFFDNLNLYPMLQSVFIYHRNVESEYLISAVKEFYCKSISTTMMNQEILLGVRCNDEHLNYAVKTDIKFTTLMLQHCTISKCKENLLKLVKRSKNLNNVRLCNSLNDDVIMLSQSLCKHSNLKLLNLQSNNITEKAAESLASAISNKNRLEKLYLGNNQLQLGVAKLATALKNISSLKVLDLHDNNIPEQVADELSAAIRANTSLEKLWLSGNHLGSSTVVVVNALKEISTLKELILNDNDNKSEELAPVLASVVANNELLEQLALKNNSLNDDGVIMIAQSLSKHSKLKCLNLRNNNITEKAAESLASAISNKNRLEKLYLGNNQLQSGVTKLTTALKNISSLKVLNLNNNNIPEQVTDELSAAIRTNTSLEKLWLSGNHLGSSTVVVVNALKEISTLKELGLDGNENRSENLAPAIAYVVANNGLLEQLTLRNNRLNDDGVIMIAQSLCKHSKLKCLNLRNNSVTEKAAESLASVMSNNNGLEELYLGNNQLQLGVTKLTTALKNISTLKVLDLNNNNMPEQAADELSIAIRANTLLEKLKLSGNHLGSSFTLITKACCHNSSLKEIAIKNIGISDGLVNDLAAVIRYNSSLEYLSISENDIQSSGFMVISQALNVISSLKYLYAYGINVTSTVSEELSFLVDNNYSMKKISLGDNLLENGLIRVAKSCSKLTNLKVLELSYNFVSSAQVLNLALIISKCNSLESLSLGGICMSINENLYLNVYRIYNKLFFEDSIIKEKTLCKNISSELLRIQICRITSIKYNRLNLLYNYWYVYITYQHKSKFVQNFWSKSDYQLIVQNTIQKLSQVDSKAMMSSLQIIKTLKVINLENNNIDEEAATELAAHLYCNNILEQLWLRGNELHDKGASVVLLSLQNLSTLLILDLSFNHLSSESADGIAAVIGNNCLLQQLWLDGNDLLTRGVVIIASALKKLSSLRILSLCSNRITDDAAEELSDVITSNVLLVDLLLGNNQLEAISVCKIAIALRKVLMLRKLDLSNICITGNAVEELAFTLSNCTNLQQLFLCNNMLETEGTIKITNALRYIHSLQVLSLSSNNITDSTADVLVDALKNNVSLKILLIGSNNLQSTGINLTVQTAKNITTLQLLDVSDNNVIEDEKEKIKVLFANNNNCTVVV